MSPQSLWFSASCRCYCLECVDTLVGPGTSGRVHAMSSWVCFLCLPFARSGLLQRRRKWRGRLKAFHDREAVRSRPRRPALGPRCCCTVPSGSSRDRARAFEETLFVPPDGLFPQDQLIVVTLSLASRDEPFVSRRRGAQGSQLAGLCRSLSPTGGCQLWASTGPPGPTRTASLHAGLPAAKIRAAQQAGAWAHGRCRLVSPKVLNQVPVKAALCRSRVSADDVCSRT